MTLRSASGVKVLVSSLFFRMYQMIENGVMYLLPLICCTGLVTSVFIRQAKAVFMETFL